MDIRVTTPERDLNLLLSRLQDVGLFENLARDQLVTLLGLAQKMTFAQGELLFAEGDDGDCMHLLVSGMVEICKTAADGQLRSFAIVQPGEPVGEMALIERGPRAASVRALEPCVTLQLSRAALTRQPRIEATVYRNLARVLVRRLRQADQDLIAITAAGDAPPAAVPAGSAVTTQ
ncbi:MAG TPA: cyclic nucleotide-binding domain-containing protein [Nevskiaceae bacterium]|nr:cyclic nucleotide-binding domain-containing protein [Nevskiaceae bacterium]